MSEIADQEIVRRVLEGQCNAFRMIVDRYAVRVFALALRLTLDSSEAEELTQEAFVRAYTMLDRYDLGRPFFTWLYTVALNVVRNHLKSRSYVPVRGSRTRPLEEGDLRGDLHTEEAAMGQEQRGRVRTGMKALPLEQREVLVLRFYEDLSFKEMAEVLGISPGAAKMRVYRALEQLRPIMEG